MPTVKFEKVRDLLKYEKYNSKDRGTPKIESAPHGMDGQMANAIEAEHERFGNARVKTKAFTIYQSWSEKESGKMNLDAYNEMGRELAERFAPGHMAFVVTHTETGKWHNHITICSVHSETGKVLDRSFSSVRGRLHEVNNEIALKNGFAPVLRRDSKLQASLSDKARRLVYQGKQSWILDMAERIDYARSVSTSFDEFVAVTHQLGVKTRVEEKNISYSFSEKKNKRGKALGSKFDKDGLMKAFKENDERFANDPKLRGQLRSDIRSAFDYEGNRLGTPSDLLSQSRSHQGLGKKDYRKFTKIDRLYDSPDLPAVFHEIGGLLYQELRKANQMSIFAYCKREGVKLKKDASGDFVLGEREFVKVREYDFTNTKSGRSGKILDFVAALHDEGYLGAVSRINQNPRLKLLEDSIGEGYKKPYQGFYSIKPPTEMAQGKQKTLSHWLHAQGGNDRSVESLLQQRDVHVGVDHSVWFINEKRNAAREWVQEKDQSWRQNHHGDSSAPWKEKVGTSNRLFVFRTPLEFAAFSEIGRKRFSEIDSFVVLFESEAHQRVNELLAFNMHIKDVFIAQSPFGGKSDHDLFSVQAMNARFKPFDIHVKALLLTDLGRERGRGPDISI